MWLGFVQDFGVSTVEKASTMRAHFAKHVFVMSLSLLMERIYIKISAYFLLGSQAKYQVSALPMFVVCLKG